MMESERRRHPRAGAQLLVERREGPAVYFHSTWDLCRGGVFVLRPHDIPLPERMDLAIHLPDGLPPVRADARVVHRLDERGARVGYGIELVGVCDDDAVRLDRYVAAQSARPM